MGRVTRGVVRTLAVPTLAVSVVALGLTEKLTGDRNPDNVGASAPVAISGDAGAAMRPGTMVPLDLELDNPNDFAITIDQISVTVREIDAPRVVAGRPCGATDFELRNLHQDVVLTIDARSASSLSDLDLSSRQWPGVGMLNRAVNQDGCRGASLTLTYEARGLGAQR